MPPHQPTPRHAAYGPDARHAARSLDRRTARAEYAAGRANLARPTQPRLLYRLAQPSDVLAGTRGLWRRRRSWRLSWAGHRRRHNRRRYDWRWGWRERRHN